MKKVNTRESLYMRCEVIIKILANAGQVYALKNSIGKESSQVKLDEISRALAEIEKEMRDLNPQ